MRCFLTASTPVTILSSVFDHIQAMRDTLRAIGLWEQSESTCDVVEATYTFLYVNHMLDAYVRNEIISSYPSL